MANYKKGNMLEKHYTTEVLLEDMCNLLDNNIDFDIAEFLENSAGSGNIIDYLKSRYKNKEIKAYDIYNETEREDIIECNYLKEKIEYKKNRVAIINPPFAKGIKFLTKALEECDYVVSILATSSLLNIDYSKYDVDDIHIYRNYDFGSCKTDIMIIALKNKI